MAGLDRHTGLTVDDDVHLMNSIEDILTTRIGTRVMRRDYGSDLPDLIDRPMSAALKVDLFAATFAALKKWEPRLLLERVQLASAEAGRVVLTLTGKRVSGEPFSGEVAL